MCVILFVLYTFMKYNSYRMMLVANNVKHKFSKQSAAFASSVK